ncbi:hemin receptor [Roseateles sp. DAIF2]|nr:hemin receptor [Roseateles sp. DAIF2]
MTPRQVAQVRASFARVEALGEPVASLFYAQLFELDPQLRALFRGDMREQGRRLLQMLAGAVALLDRPEQLLPVLRLLGARHQGYGVQERHYASVGAALIRTLEQGLGPGFTPELRAAWLAVYDLVSRTMREAAQPLAA